MDFNVISGVGISVVSGEADIKRGTEVPVVAFAANGSGVALVRLEQILVEQLTEPHQLLTESEPSKAWCR